MGMYTALMKEIDQGIERIRQNKLQVVEVNLSGKVVSQPFSLDQKKSEEPPRDK